MNATSGLSHALMLIVPTGAPHNVTSSTTSRSVTVSWDDIECLERNGEITGYTVVFQQQGRNVTERNFTASGLTPHTNYTFRVAGVNSNGTGPFSANLIILTDEEGTNFFLFDRLFLA